MIFKSTQKTYLSVLIIFLVISSSKLQNNCNKNLLCQTSFICKNEICIHKNLFPLATNEIFQLIIMMLLSLAATTAGMGGGVVYSILFMFFSNFHARQAFPISNFMIFFCSFSTFCVGIKDKIQNPEIKFIDFNLSIIFFPTQLLGTKIGVILNNVFPEFLLNVLLVVVLVISIYKTYHNALNQRLKECQFQSEFHFDFKEEILEKKEKESKDKTIEIIKEDLPHFEDKYPIRPNIIKILILLEFILIIDTLFEGNDKFASILGIRKCSIPFWMIFISFSFLCIFVAKYFIRQIRREAEGNANRMSESFRISRQETSIINNIMFQCFLGGIISGMLGIGGGIIITPLMLDLKINPIVATSTSNFLLMFTSSAASILYILAGELLFDYALFYALLCGLSSLIGSIYIKKYIKRTRKNSILLYFLLVLMMISFVLLPINGFNHAINDLNHNVNIFAFRNLC